MKKLAFVIASVAALVVAAYWILSPRPAAVARLPAAAPATSATPGNAAPAPIRDEPVQPKAVEPQHATPLSEPKQPPNAQNVPSNQARPRSAPIAPGPKDEKQQMAACSTLWDSQKKREQAAHDAETKDPAWAYATEQKLREWAARRLRATSIEVIAIDCKTTFCDLVAQGFGQESSNEISNALEDVHKEPWSDFTWSSLSNTTEGRKVTYTVELRRKQSYATPFEAESDDPENVACERLISQQNQRERATRDTQPRDPAWADQMEQLLGQHIANRLVKHPVQQLSIECKTTFCLLRARGQMKDSQRAFVQASHEAAAEPWANLRVGETGNTGYPDGWWRSDVTLHRQ
jgi:hypothetical protein